MGVSALSTVSIPAIGAQVVSSLTEDRRRSLLAALEGAEENYDPAEGMMRSRVSSAGYHTTLKSGEVHQTRGSLTYAAALLDAGGDNRLARAQTILERVIALQDQKPASKTYGIWSWYLEEPLDKMSPPDWNWADFCGVQLLAAWIGHQERLAPDVREMVRESILHAARSIERRNVTPRYTNIAIMGTYVTLVTAERFGLADLLDYARKRLRKVHHYVLKEAESFTEYNSSTYTTVAISELSRMLLHFQRAEDLALVEDVNALAWKHVATHFHAPTRQWAGPMSRCYQTDLRDRKNTLAVLEVGTGRRAKLIDEDPLPLGLDAYRLPYRCPGEYIPLFCTLEEPRTTIEVFQKREPEPVVGTTYLHPKYTLGSVNQADFWIQRRAVLAYWGDVLNPTYLQVRFLHDDYDYCSGLPFTSQHLNASMTVVVFATDYGDTHVNLDMVKDGTIRANDLRLRFEIGATIADVQVESKEEPSKHYLITDRDTCILLQPAECVFDGQQVAWEVGRNEEKAWIDAVCYTGPERAIDFRAMKQAFLTFALRVSSSEDTTLEHLWSIERDGERTTAKGPLSRTPNPVQLSVGVPIKPGKIKELRAGFHGGSSEIVE